MLLVPLEQGVSLGDIGIFPSLIDRGKIVRGERCRGCGGANPVPACRGDSA